MGDQVKLLACRPMRQWVLCSTQLLCSNFRTQCFAADPAYPASGTLQSPCFAAFLQGSLITCVYGFAAMALQPCSALQHCVPCGTNIGEDHALGEEVHSCLTFPSCSDWGMHCVCKVFYLRFIPNRCIILRSQHVWWHDYIGECKLSAQFH